MTQSAWYTGGLNATAIRHLGVVFAVLLSVIFLAVIVIAVLTLFRRHRGFQQEPLEHTHQPSAQTERSLRSSVVLASVTTVLVLFALIVASVSVGKTISSAPPDNTGLIVEVTGEQWWWKIRYLNDDPSQIIVTANEIHVPTGRRVVIRGMSDDVIHSFWVPGLQGKRDLIPGHITTEWFQADRPGRYRGQCAEFCGLQHAHMAFWVVAETPDRFEEWKQRQLQPAHAPLNEMEQKGHDIFLTSACILCHAIQGTPAAAQIAPDLTHFGSRLTIAAGELINNKGNLAGWIADPQNIKPGTRMATVPLKPGEMQPLIEYLEALQ